MSFAFLYISEIYADMVFQTETFYSMASISSTVPILTCGGLAKRFLVPGWRVGWIFVYDHLNVMNKVYYMSRSY